jgi:hypothetical protein
MKTAIDIVNKDKLITICLLYTDANQPMSGHPIIKVNAAAENPRPESLWDNPNLTKLIVSTGSK